MAVVKTARFLGNLQVDNTITGPTINRIDTEKTNVLNSLNSHISNYNASESANALTRTSLQNQINNNNSALTTSISTLQTTVSDNKTDIEAKLATETSTRLASVNDLNTAIANRNTFVDGELSRLQTQHVSDDGRLTQIETDLKAVDTNIQQQITDQIAVHNADVANLDPRVQKFEQFFVIDDVNQTITFKNYKVIVEGDFEQGVTTTQSTADGSFGNPINHTNPFDFDSNNATSIIQYNATDYTYTLGTTSITGPYTDSASVLSKIQVVDSQVQAIDAFILINDISTSSNVELALVSGSSGFKAFLMN